MINNESNTFPVEIKYQKNDNYCPYCNKYFSINDIIEGRIVMTVDHIIPQSIGGKNNFTITICKSCNNNFGSKIDMLLNQDSILSYHGIKCGGGGLNQYAKHESQARLVDGQWLQGHSLFKKNSKNSWSPDFIPFKNQPDGSKWIKEFRGDKSKLPKDVNILESKNIDKISYNFNGPELLHFSYLKILFSAIYYAWGSDIIKNASFDIMRKCLKNNQIYSEIEYKWFSFDEYNKINTLNPIQKKEHTIWGGCVDGINFIGGVSLFGLKNRTMEVRIKNFEMKLEGRFCTIPLASQINN